MTINTRKQAINEALAQTTNQVGTCQLTVRGWYNAPSAGDVDQDGDADAVDGWESEPKAYRHPGDRDAPCGVPLAFSGGSHGFGHRAMSLLNPGRLRSTDMLSNRYHAGTTSTVGATGSTADAIGIIERSMGVHYLGWSETIDGVLIPDFKQKTSRPPRPQTRGWRIDQSLRRLRKALAQTDTSSVKGKLRARMLKASIKSLLAIPTHDKKKH